MPSEKLVLPWMQLVLHQAAAMAGHSRSRAAPCREAASQEPRSSPWGLSSVSRARVLKRVSAIGIGLEHQFLVALLWDTLQDFSGVMCYLSIRFILPVCAMYFKFSHFTTSSVRAILGKSLNFWDLKKQSM